jgi:hypothetical protein
VIDREKDVLQAAADRLKSDLLDKFHDLSVAQIIEGFIAILSDALLQSLENVLLAVLDVLEAVAAGVADALDTAIDIPVISGLYKEIAGDDLSLLDVACLIGAIPATICGKLFTGAAPFPDDARTAALIGAADFATIQRIRQPQPRFAAALELMASAPHDDNDPADPASKLTKNLVLSGAILALAGEYVMNVVTFLRQVFPESVGLVITAAVCYLPYNAPSIMGDLPNLAKLDVTVWADWMNYVLTILMGLKAAADIVIARSPAATTWSEDIEPWVDMVASIIWMIPTIGSIATLDPAAKPAAKAVAGLNFVAGTAFCVNGALAPALAQGSADDPVTAVVFDSIAAVFNHLWGVLSVAAAVTVYADPDAV